MKNFGKDIEMSLVKSQLGDHYMMFNQLKNVEKLKGIQARMDYDLTIK
jgi:hypothetical protein